MHQRRAWALGALLLSLNACERGKGSPISSSTDAQDALWALAPAGTRLGLVATPRAMRMVDAGRTTFLAALARLPDLAALEVQIDDAVRAAIGTTEVDLPSRGLSLDKGLALFKTSAGSVLVLPVVDPAKFQATRPDLACKTVRDFYVCAETAALLDTVGGKGMPDAVKLVGARGDIELAGSGSGTGPSIEYAAVAQLDRGSVVVRGAIKGISAFVPQVFSKAARPRIERDHTSGFGVIDLTTVLANIPPEPLVPDLTTDQLAKTVSGPATVSAAGGSNVIDVRIPLSDIDPAYKLVSQCDKLSALQDMSPSVKDGTCHFTVQPRLVEVDMWIEHSELRFKVSGAAGGNAVVPMSAIGKELASRAWPFAFYGRGTIFALREMPPEQPEDLGYDGLAFFHAVTMVNELGLASRMDGDTMRILVVVRTAWSNPDDVVAKLEAIPLADVLAGNARPAAKAIADGAKGSPFADDFASGYGGLMVPVVVLGALASTAIPAFTGYLERSKAGAPAPAP